MVLLTEEVGELARIIARTYGEQSFKENENERSLANEMADVLFVLICLANQTGVNLDEALKENLLKKSKRDATRHQNNINFNIFNIDMVYRWVFSPGSEVNFIWKNIIQSNILNTKVNYFQNLENTLQQEQINSFTIKVLYYLDYLWVKQLVNKDKIRANSF